MRRQRRGSLVVAVAGGLLALSAPAAHAATATALPHYVDVVGNGHAVTVSHPSVEGGPVTLRVATSNPSNANGGGSSVVMFRLQNGATLNKVFADFGEEFGGNPAKGTRDLTRDALFTGLADPTVGRPILVTERLSPGTYYLIDIAAPTAGPPAVTTLTVKPGDDSRPLGTSTVTVTVKGTSSDMFLTSTRWARQGVVRWQNVSDTLHFMDATPVKAGTTDAQVQAYFDSGSQQPPAFARQGVGYGLDVLSPGREELATYSLPPGTYVLLCFVADDHTGMPHALMGMHKVITVS